MLAWRKWWGSAGWRLLFVPSAIQVAGFRKPQGFKLPA
jgi:hypothetical protein